jgi:hypothetical protein
LTKVEESKTDDTLLDKFEEKRTSFNKEKNVELGPKEFLVHSLKEEFSKYIRPLLSSPKESKKIARGIRPAAEELSNVMVDKVMNRGMRTLVTNTIAKLNAAVTLLGTCKSELSILVKSVSAVESTVHNLKSFLLEEIKSVSSDLDEIKSENKVNKERFVLIFFHVLVSAESQSTISNFFTQSPANFDQNSVPVALVIPEAIIMSDDEDQSMKNNEIDKSELASSSESKKPSTKENGEHMNVSSLPSGSPLNEGLQVEAESATSKSNGSENNDELIDEAITIFKVQYSLHFIF